MYSTCLFCHLHLGRNELIEPFPVGRRLAYDESRGRLWVVCTACGRWNLTPLEERWEAIEQCERLFRATRTRVSTDNVGMARPKGGLELVRIGRPLRPEMAAWRYGGQFVRRYRRTLVKAGALGSALGVALGGALGGLFNPGLLLLYPMGVVPVWLTARQYVRVARVPLPGGEALNVARRDLNATRLVATESRGNWRLDLPGDDSMLSFEGERAKQALASLLVPLNGFGASQDTVSDALRSLEEASDADHYLALAARDALPDDSAWTRWGRPTRPMTEPPSDERSRPLPVREVPLAYLRAEHLLAIEMLVHEDTERLAMEGELASLERAWRQAEELAAIADSLLLPPGVEEFLAKHRRG